jgi:hypothetical protein
VVVSEASWFGVLALSFILLGTTVRVPSAVVVFARVTVSVVVLAPSGLDDTGLLPPKPLAKNSR